MNASYPKRSLKPLVIALTALTVALSSSAALAEWYEGYVPKQQESMAVNVGSGYTGDETVSQNAQPASDVPLAEDYVPLVLLVLDTPYQMGSGYTSLIET
jgi:hypothetical protein